MAIAPFLSSLEKSELRGSLTRSLGGILQNQAVGWGKDFPIVRATMLAKRQSLLPPAGHMVELCHRPDFINQRA